MGNDSRSNDLPESMGLVHATLLMRNPRTGQRIEVRALADSGALLLCIPESVALVLNLSQLDKREIALADGRHISAPYVGPVELHFKNRSCFTGALVLGEEVLLGAVPMEDLDVLVHPARRELIVNPDSPNVAFAPVKTAAA